MKYGGPSNHQTQSSPTTFIRSGSGSVGGHLFVEPYKCLSRVFCRPNDVSTQHSSRRHRRRGDDRRAYRRARERLPLLLLMGGDLGRTGGRSPKVLGGRRPMLTSRGGLAMLPFLHGKKVISEVFNDFARAGPVGWRVIWKVAGPAFKPSPPLLTSPQYLEKRCIHFITGSVTAHFNF